MSTPTPTLKIEWRGDPSGPRWVHVFFMDDSAPKDLSAAGTDFVRRLEDATNEPQFNNRVMTFAERNHLRVVEVNMASSHKYPVAEVITVTFGAERPLTLTVDV